MASLQFAECAEFGFHFVQRGAWLMASRLRYGSILDVLGQLLGRGGDYFIGGVIRAGPVGRVDPALLFGLEFDGHRGISSGTWNASTPIVQQRCGFGPAAAFGDYPARIFSAAARPMRMQSGMPMPWSALPATYRPEICARRASSSAWRAGCPTVYCAMERGQRAMLVQRGRAVTPAISRSSPVTAAATASSLSPNTPASSMPPRKQRATILPLGTRYENLVPTQVHATNRRRSFLGTRNPKPEGCGAKSAASKPTATVIDELYATLPISSASGASTGASSAAPLCASQATTTRSASSHSPSRRTRNPVGGRSTVSARASRTSTLPEIDPAAASTSCPRLPFRVRNNGAGVCDLGAGARAASTPRVRLPYLAASSTKRGNTAVTLSSRGSPP